MILIDKTLWGKKGKKKKQVIQEKESKYDFKKTKGRERDRKEIMLYIKHLSSDSMWWKEERKESGKRKQETLDQVLMTWIFTVF